MLREHKNVAKEFNMHYSKKSNEVQLNRLSYGIAV